MDLITSVNNSNVKFNFSNTNYNNFPYSLACYKKRFSVCEIWRFTGFRYCNVRQILLQGGADITKLGKCFYKVATILIQSNAGTKN